MECQPHRRREPGRTLPELPEGAHTWISDFWPQDCERTSFCCLKPPVCGTLLWQPQEMNTGPFGQGIPSPLALTRPTSRLDLCPAQASSHRLSPRPAGSTGQWHVLSINAQNLAASCSRWSECAERHTCLPRLISGGKSTGNNTELE